MIWRLLLLWLLGASAASARLQVMPSCFGDGPKGIAPLASANLVLKTSRPCGMLGGVDGLAASYEYGPFGELIRANGPLAQANPFRFSTKYQDLESGDLNFGCRYYNPSTGRWLNRDPMGEAGGLNLYGFVDNNPIDYYDFLGREGYWSDVGTTLWGIGQGAKGIAVETEHLGWDLELGVVLTVDPKAGKEIVDALVQDGYTGSSLTAGAGGPNGRIKTFGTVFAGPALALASIPVGVGQSVDEAWNGHLDQAGNSFGQALTTTALFAAPGAKGIGISTFVAGTRGTAVATLDTVTSMFRRTEPEGALTPTRPPAREPIATEPQQPAPTKSGAEKSPVITKAAESGTQALEPMANAAFNTGTIRTVAGYDVAGNAGLVGQTYNVNVWGLYATESSQGPFALVNALKGEASAAGASQISITGNAVVNQGLLNISPGVAGRLGLQFQQINPTTILLQGAIH